MRGAFPDGRSAVEVWTVLNGSAFFRFLRRTGEAGILSPAYLTGSRFDWEGGLLYGSGFKGRRKQGNC